MPTRRDPDGVERDSARSPYPEKHILRVTWQRGDVTILSKMLVGYDAKRLTRAIIPLLRGVLNNWTSELSLYGKGRRQ